MYEYEGIIYKATCLVNNKVYIGKTINGFNRRKRQHERCAMKNEKSYYFHKSIKKHGEYNFNWEIIDTAKTEEELNLLEELYIEEYRQNGNIYNLTDGGEGMSGHKHTEETKIKMSLSHKGRSAWNKGMMHTQETKLKMSIAHKGKHTGPKTEEHKRKLSEANKGHIAWNKGKPGLKGEQNHFYGKHHTKETREKISAIHKDNKYFLGHKHTEETKFKISEAKKGKPSWNKGKSWSDEIKKRMKEAKKYTSEETRKNMREAQRIRREREACLCP